VNFGLFVVLFVQSTVVLATAWLLTRVFRDNSLARRTISRSAVAGIFAVLVLTPVGFIRPAPLVPVPSSAREVLPLNLSQPPAPIETSREKNLSQEPSMTANAASASAVTPDPYTWELVVVILWLAGTGIQAARLLAGAMRLRRIHRRSNPVSNTSLSEFPPVRQSSDVSFPFVMGLRRPTVYLPADLSPEVREFVRHHELAHIQNRDLYWSLAARILTVALWPQPLIWWLQRSLAAATEEECDAAVIAAGLPREKYATALLDLRQRLRSTPLTVSAMAGLSLGTINPGAKKRPSVLYRRIEAIMKTKPRPLNLSPKSRLLTILGTIGICVATVLVFNRAATAQTPPDPMAGYITQPYPFNVVVTDSQGKPVTGARAWITVTGDVPEPFELPITVTGSRLAFAVKPVPRESAGILVVDAPGHPLYFKRVWPVKEKIGKISLFPPKQTTVRVLLPDGQPAAGLKIGPTMLVDRSKPDSKTEISAFTQLTPSRTKELSVTISANGLATFDKIPPRTDARLDVSDDRYATLGYDDRFDSTKSGLQTITLRQSAEISGRVTSAGKPVAGVTIGVQDNTANYSVSSNTQDIWGSTVSDADGNYTIKRLGSGLVNVMFDERSAQSRELTAEAHENIQTKPGSVVSNVNFELISGGIVEGRVTDSAGKPVPNIGIGIYGPAHPRSSAWVQRTVTDAKGRYQLRVPSGKNYVYCMDGQYSQRGFDVMVQNYKKTTQDIVLSPNPNPDR